MYYCKSLVFSILFLAKYYKSLNNTTIHSRLYAHAFINVGENYCLIVVICADACVVPVQDYALRGLLLHDVEW